MTQGCHYDFKLQAEYLQLVGSEISRKTRLGSCFGSICSVLFFYPWPMKVAVGHVQSSQGNPWPPALYASPDDPNNVPGPKINSRCVFKYQ